MRSAGLTSTRRLILALGLCLVGPHAGSALDLSNVLTGYSVTGWSERNGTRLGAVWALARTTDGYLWLGTDDGLVRFDGVRFTRWQPSTAPADGARMAPVRALHVDHRGSLWVGFAGSVGVRVLADGRLEDPDPNSPSRPSAVRSLVSDNSGVVWAGGGDGLFALERGRWRRLEESDGVPGSGILSLRLGSDDELLIAAESGAYRWTQNPAGRVRVSGEHTDGVALDPGGRLWFTDVRAGFRTIDGAASRPTRPASQTRGRELLYDSVGDLWVGTLGQGLWRVRNPGTPLEAAESFTVELGLLNNGVFSLLEDEHGIWVGTNAGLNLLSRHRLRPVTNLGIVLSIEAADNTSAWVGTVGGLLHLTTRDEAARSETTRLAGTQVMIVHRDVRNDLWLATAEGLGRLAGDRLLPVRGFEGLPPGRFSSLTSDRSGRVWVAHRDGGVFAIDPQAMTARSISARNLKDVTLVHADAGGHLWVVADGGQTISSQVVTDATGATEHPPSCDSASIGVINAIMESPRSGLWFATSSGLVKFSGGRCARLGREHGLPPEPLTAIAEDAEGTLWVTTSGALLRIDRQSAEAALASPRHRLRYVVLDETDGLAGVPGRGQPLPKAVRVADDFVLFVTGRGVTVVDPRVIPADIGDPDGSVKIEAVVAGDELFDPVADMSLPPHVDRLRIDYTALNVKRPTRLRFRYRLEGLDSDWTDAGSSREATYTNLGPGAYRFHVQATNEMNSGVELVAVWPFSVQPAIYQTRQFAFSVVVLGGFVVWGVWQLRLRQMRRQFAQVFAERARVSRELHDTLLQSLAGVALQIGDAAADIEHAPMTVQAQLLRIRKQVEQYATEAARTIRDLRLPLLERHTLPDALREMVSRVTEGTAIQVTVSVSGVEDRLPYAWQHQILRLAQEAVTNVVRHASASRLEIDLRYEPAQVVLSVRDDGVGFEPSSTPESDRHFGIAMMRERAEQLAGRLSLRRRPNGGTEIEAIVPRPSEAKKAS